MILSVMALTAGCVTDDRLGSATSAETLDEPKTVEDCDREYDARRALIDVKIRELAFQFATEMMQAYASLLASSPASGTCTPSQLFQFVYSTMIFPLEQDSSPPGTQTSTVATACFANPSSPEALGFEQLQQAYEALFREQINALKAEALRLLKECLAKIGKAADMEEGDDVLVLDDALELDATTR
jgi:hypothetical protein